MAPSMGDDGDLFDTEFDWLKRMQGQEDGVYGNEDQRHDPYHRRDHGG